MATRTRVININKNRNVNVAKSAVGEHKKLKLQFIPSNPNGQANNFQLQINPKAWPNLKVGDILEISSTTKSTADEDSSPILLQVVEASLNEQIPQDAIRVDQVASSSPFFLKVLAFVNVKCVDKSDVVLDIVELLFKEQYFNGNDMMRIKKHMENTCVYIKKGIDFSGMRCSVREMWIPNADIVSCGYISEKTRLVFRAQSAMCTIYIQMSKEMWEFDVNGEMYHEKAVNFLGELFKNWKNQCCSHDVTIALFSRVFYDAKSIEEFPPSISSSIQDNRSENKDNKSRFYEDFYRVIYQNERFEDWTPTLVIIKRLIKEYRDYILNYYNRQFGKTVPNFKMPARFLSSAAEGNFLETLILSSNVFERHFIDRPFDRTGMMSLVITPGNGLFEVSRELSNITKDRVIDNAIGSDLVCLGEQPLHSVPLFKYEADDDYDVPHWINLSFYKSSETVRFCNSKFLPCAKIKIKSNAKHNKISDADSILPNYTPDKNNYQKSLEDTDKMFEYIKNKNPKRVNTMPSSLNTQSSVTASSRALMKARRAQVGQQNQRNLSMVNSFNESANDSNNFKNTGYSMIETDLPSTCKNLPLESVENESYGEDSDSDQLITGSSTSIFNRRKVNPFTPSTSKPKMSFERRRWVHAFPLRGDGTPIYQHWTTVPTQNELENLSPIGESYNEDIKNISPDSSKIFLNQNKNMSRNERKNNKLIDYKSSSFNWEIIHKNESKAFMKPGVAWKSLTTPAALPLTTDYFPKSSSWISRYEIVGDYALLLDAIRSHYGYRNYEYNQISMEQVFYELVGHRLAMGFQMVVPKRLFTKNDLNSTVNGTNDSTNFNKKNNMICDLSQSTSVKARSLESTKGYYKLCLGRMYHELFYKVSKETNEDKIEVEINEPKQKTTKGRNNSKTYYSYRFQVPDSKSYDISHIQMNLTSNDPIQWNLIDSYICIQGNGSLTPSELKKCWRQRIYLVPIMYTATKPSNKQLRITSTESTSCSNSSDKTVENSNPSTQSSPKCNSVGSTETLPSCNKDSAIFIYNIQTAGIIPASMLEDQIVPAYCDIYQRKSVEELTFFREFYFIKFMEGLNKINRIDDRRYFSRACLAYSDSMNNHATGSSTNDQSIAVSVIMNSLTSNSNYTVNPNPTINLNSSQKLNNTVNVPNLSKHYQSTCQKSKHLTSPKTKLYGMLTKYLKCLEKPSDDPDSAASLKTKSIEIKTYLNSEYVSYMISSDGIPFYENKNDIPLNCFISSESVWWCIEHIIDIESEADAIVFMQILCDYDLVRHISNQQKVFIHGFNLYYIITEETRNHHVYTKDYCEVGFSDVEFNRAESNQTANSLMSVGNLLPRGKKSLPISAEELFTSYSNLISKYSKKGSTSVSPSSYLKLVNVDVDPNHKSNRVEWASAVYRSHYHQLCAFELELQWEMATGQLLAELMNSWTKLANRFNYHIVAAPIDPFAMPIDKNSDPLRGPIFVKLNFQCLIQNERVLFENSIDKSHKLYNYDAEKIENDFKLDSGMSVGSTTSFSCVMEQLEESNPEFMEFVFRKCVEKKKCVGEGVRQFVERKIQNEPEFIEQEFQEFVEWKRILRLQNFQEAILEKFGFVRNAALFKSLYSDDDQMFFIHSSGGMFVCIPNYHAGYEQNRSRHTSSNSTNSVTTTTSSILKSAFITKQINPLNDANMLSNSPLKSDDLPQNSLENAKLQMNAVSNSTPYTSSHSRDRSNTKSHLSQYIKLNEHNFKMNEQNFKDENDLNSKLKINQQNCKNENDLLFRPKTNDLRFSNKSNEKLDIIQQQQREQMLLQSTTPTQSSNLETHMAMSNEPPFSIDNKTIKDLRKPFYLEPDTYIQFSWSWNFMLGKRWRSQYTGDEAFQDNVLADFKIFCSNKDGRLLKFFNEIRDNLD